MKSIVDGTNSVDSNGKIDFDLMADIDDDNETSGVNEKSLKYDHYDWSHLFERDYPLVSFTVNCGNLLFCNNHTFQQCFAHTINAHAKNGYVYHGNASAQFYRNCVKDGTEECLIVEAIQLYLSFDKVPLNKNIPWTKNVNQCDNPPVAPYYEVQWSRCTPYSGYKCSDEMLKGFLSQGPYMSQMCYSFATMNYTGGILPTDNCRSPSVGAIVVKIDDEYVKARPPFGVKYGEQGFIRVKNEEIAHPEVSCGLKSYGFIPDVMFVET